MKRFAALFLLLGVVLTGCPPKENTAATDGKTAPTNGTTAATDAASAGGSTADGAAENANGAAASAAYDALKFSASDALIQFVGTHADPDKPDPRTGTFGQFSGTATVADGKLTSIHVVITTESLSTSIPDLTKHLKSGDFFNVNEFPTAEFQTTSIEDAGEGKFNITGDLTLLGKTKAVTFPATVSTTDGLHLDASFKIDRTEFGMDYGADKVLKDVELTVKIPK